MRTSDATLPTFTPTDPAEALIDWPAHPHLLLEGATEPPYTWDSGRLWDDGAIWNPPYVGIDLVDAVCDLAGVDVEHGNPDSANLYPAGRMVATLLDPDGRYSRIRHDGTLEIERMGRRVHLVTELDDVWWWTFSGRITRWDEIRPGEIEIEAYNAPTELVPVGAPYTPGTAGQQPNVRLQAILAATDHGELSAGSRFDTGTVALTAQETERSPWEEMQVVAQSDGGILFPDADNAIVYFDRDWTLGRDDQASASLWGVARWGEDRWGELTWAASSPISDNLCDAGAIVVWNCELSTNDAELTGQVVLTNVAELVADESMPIGPDAPVRPIFTYSEPGQWTTQAEGDTLAGLLLDQRFTARLRIASFQLYLHAGDPEMWQFGVDLRIGDRLRFLHSVRQPGQSPTTIDVGLIVTSIAQSLNPHEWVVTVGTSQVVDYRSTGGS
jgi:hypothetical protein